MAKKIRITDNTDNEKEIKSTKKRKNKYIIIVIAFLVIIAIIVSIYFFLKNNESLNNSNNNNHNEKTNIEDDKEVECIYYDEAGKIITGRIEDDGSYTEFVDCGESKIISDTNNNENDNTIVESDNNKETSNNKIDNTNDSNYNNKNSSTTNNSTTNNNDISSENNSNTSKNTNELINATKEYYCTDNYTLNGTKCQYKFTNPALQRYYCESGTLNGTKCTGSSNVPFSAYTSAVREQCQGLAGSGNYDSCLCSKSGGSYDSTNKICYKNQTVSTNAQLEYYCTSDLTLEGSNCVKYYSLDAMYKYTCPNGYTLEIDKCRK